jgi:hypothetical protein
MSLHSTTSLSPVSAGELALLPTPAITKAVAFKPIRFSGSDYLDGGVSFTMEAVCMAFMLPKEVIEWSVAVDAYFMRARMIGMSRVHAQAILDEEMNKAKASLTTTSLQALSIARRRIVEQDVTGKPYGLNQVWNGNV